MLHTWKASRWDGKKSVEFTRAGVVTPDCCDAVKTTLAVRLLYNPAEVEKLGLKKAVPKWTILFPQHLWNEMLLAIRSWECPSPIVCPFCATPLPAVVRRKVKAGKTYRPDAMGDYCASCGERSMCCICNLPEASWRPVTEVEHA